MIMEEDLISQRKKLEKLVVRMVSDLKKGTDFKTKMEDLEKRLCGQRDFLNMVVHDLRNPCESIEHGLEYVLEFQNDEIKTIVNDMIREIQKNYIELLEWDHNQRRNILD